jgi:hypothetical protein
MYNIFVNSCDHADTLSFLRKFRVVPIIRGLCSQFWKITLGVLIGFGNVRLRLSLLILVEYTPLCLKYNIKTK